MSLIVQKAQETIEKLTHHGMEIQSQFNQVQFETEDPLVPTTVVLLIDCRRGRSYGRSFG